ncbi:hypothetical protein GUJ93_ZPchr0016g2608 [Zizania palustris]|uniref:Uncharacterized protein n=1 Tax=Zizania palustris TaxID=103762 RepID=A0A8J5THK1_ZIZPA|nr:hypothetical protein GUJ93_ZPchr0016g2608 [Zizania palustris]
MACDTLVLRSERLGTRRLLSVEQGTRKPTPPFKQSPDITCHVLSALIARQRVRPLGQESRVIFWLGGEALGSRHAAPDTHAVFSTMFTGDKLNHN